MKLTKLAFAAAVSCALGFAGTTIAAQNVIEKSVTITASIPTNDFYVTPVGDWMSKTQELSWNSATKELSSVKEQVSLKHAQGSITARLLAPGQLTSDTNSIPLKVIMNGKQLNETTAVEVASEAEAPAGKVVPFAIEPTQGNHAVGDYSGVVNLIFEAVPKAP